MTVSEVLALLDAERDERGMSNWEKLGSSTAGMKSYGIWLDVGRRLVRRGSLRPVDGHVRRPAATVAHCVRKA